ncbi:MAG TPA: phosphatase PAP2 family protein [Blastocatellia bacterium]|nr:phosphatase PAP2 family protein [Blastocatellia bacterium]
MKGATGSLGDKEPAAVEPEAPPSDPEITVSPRRAGIRARWAEIVFLSCLSVYTALAVLARVYTHFAWDLEVMRGIQSVRIPGFGPLMIWLSLLGSGWVPTALVGGVGITLALARFRLEGGVCIVGVTLGAVLNSLLKVMTGRPRPDPALVDVIKLYNHDSFPSGHVVFFVEYFGFLFFLSYVLLRRGRLRSVLLLLFGILIVLIGASRVYMGAHWPSDVLGAYLAGGIWLMVMISIYRRLKARQTNLTS